MSLLTLPTDDGLLLRVGPITDGLTGAPLAAALVRVTAAAWDGVTEGAVAPAVSARLVPPDPLAPGGYALTLALADLPPGRYRLRVVERPGTIAERTAFADVTVAVPGAPPAPAAAAPDEEAGTSAGGLPIITGADLASYLGLSRAEADGGRFAIFAAGASAYIVRRTARDWTVALRRDTLRGSGTRFLVLRHTPILAVERVYERAAGSTAGAYATAAAPGAFDGARDVGAVAPVLDLGAPGAGVYGLADERAGLLARTDGRVWPRTDVPAYTVVYTGGVDGAPADLRVAALELAAYLFQTTGGRTTVTTGSSVQFANLAGRGVAALPMVDSVIRAHSDNVFAP